MTEPGRGETAGVVRRVSLGAALLAALTSMTVAIVPEVAQAVDCPENSQETAAARADLIAAARVVAVDAQKVTLALQRVFKGSGDWQIEAALAPGASGLRGGESYLIFAQKTEAGFAIGPCGGSLPHAQAGAVIDGLGPGYKPGASGDGAPPTPAPSSSAAPSATPPRADPAAGAPTDGSQAPPQAGGCAACAIDRRDSQLGWLPLFALAAVVVARRRRS